ncbi:hypothetical protein HC891_24340 [Candidatus Gracilibacteria bacterium]|nr:hypothetical protein [Candidatus Gracilibacteria bacterium]
MLLLSRGDPFFEPRFLVTLEVDEETDLLVSTEEPGVTIFDFVAQPDGWVLDEGFLDFSDQVLAALDEAADTLVGRERVLPLLMGNSRPQADGDRLHTPWSAHGVGPQRAAGRSARPCLRQRPGLSHSGAARHRQDACTRPTRAAFRRKWRARAGHCLHPSGDRQCAE